jgi:hypothetical protein
MGIMDFFRTAATQPGQGQQPPQPNGGAAPITNDPSAANPTAPGAASTSANTTGTQQGAFPAVEAEGPKSPLDGFTKLWETDPKAKPQASMVPQINGDPQKIRDAAKNIDFTKQLSPTTLEGIAKGDVKAFLAGINEVGQAALAHSASTTTGLITAALTAQEKTFREEVMPDMLRKHNVSNALRTDNPLFDNPAVKPVLTMIENQFQVKNPSASAGEITTLAKQYLSGFATELLTASGKVVSDPPSTSSSNGLARKDTDWGKFFDASLN